MDVNSYATHINKPAIYLAILKGHYKMVELLLKRGADPFVECYRGTSLIWAAIQARKYRIELVKLLLSYDVPLSGDHDAYLRPTVLYQSRENYKILKLLLENRLKTSNVESLKDYVLNCYSVRIFKLLLKHIDPKEENDLLHFTAEHNSKHKFVRALIKTGFDVNAKDWRGCTPIEKAVHIGAYKNVKILLDYNADISLLDEKTMHNNIRVTRILLPHMLLKKQIVSPELRDSASACEKELEKMKMIIVSTRVSLYDFIRTNKSTVDLFSVVQNKLVKKNVPN